MTTYSGQIVDIENREIFPGTITVERGRITEVKESQGGPHYILPGFIDAHVHIESSLLVPQEFARIAVVHGTVASVSDPHEIANVVGIPGIKYMVYDALMSPFKFWFGAPSCVPATTFETAGATIGPEGVAECFDLGKLKYLSEMMNYPGVLHDDPVVWDKIEEAHLRHLPIDGHAPGLMGEEIKRYAAAGITTDHESFRLDEALGKIKCGMKIAIREGSAAKNYEALHSLLDTHPGMCMFCSDDKHCNELVEGHINELVVRSIAKGHNLFNILQVACLNPVLHYRLPVGLLREKDPADFIIVNNLKEFHVLETYINGRCVAKEGKTLINRLPVGKINNFGATPKEPDDFLVKASGKSMRVIVALDGQLVTKSEVIEAKIDPYGYIVPDIRHDVLKIAVVNRYKDEPPAMAFVKNFGIERGALASSVAHDSHNIIAIGVTDNDICKAVNLVIRHKGGLACVVDGEERVLALPVAGLMSDDDGYIVAKEYEELEHFVKIKLRPTLTSPFMTMSFLALLVIPELKLSDKGLFDVTKFAFTPLSF